MSKLATQLSASRGLLNAVDVVTNKQAFLTLLSTLLATALIGSGLSWLSVKLLMSGHGTLSSLLGLGGGLILLFVLMLGASATGFLVNDQMRGREVRSVSAALAAALTTLPRLLAVAALLFLFAIALVIAVLIVLVVCKIPGLGPLLYTFVFPAVALTLGIFFYASAFVCSLSGPALWEGNSALRILALLWSVVRNKLLVVLIQSILLGLLVGLISGLIGMALFFGIGMTSTLSSLVLSTGRSNGLMMDLMRGNANGYIVAAGIGGGLLTAIAMTVPVLVAIAGQCLIFANVSEDLSTEDYEAALAERLAQVKEKGYV